MTDGAEDGLEINGVNGTIDDWREILLPLLLIKQDGDRFVDQMKCKADAIGQEDASADAPSSRRSANPLAAQPASCAADP